MRAQVKSGSRSLQRRHADRARWVGVVPLLLLAMTVRAIDLERLPITDELYTFLAAQGWLETGAPRIAQGLYERAEAYTLLLAGWLAIFGETMVAARTLSLLFGSCLVAAVFLWTWRVAGGLAAWIAGLFLALAPLSIDVSQFVRFYTLHALVFWLSATGAYAVTARWYAPDRRIAIAIAAIVGFWFALHLQILTMIGLAGLGLWLVLTVGIPWLRAQNAPRRRIVLTAVGVLALLAGAALLLSGAAEALLKHYRAAPLWVRAHRNEFWFYHLHFVERWPTLWSLTPLALLLAVMHRPRPAVFCTCVFVVSFVLLSFGGMKEERYLFFSLPFLFVLWGIALAKTFDILHPWLVTAVDRVLRRLTPYLAGRVVRAGLIAAGVLFLLGSNGGMVKALLSLSGARLVATAGGIGISGEMERANWAAARATLAPWLKRASVIVTSNDVHFLYYLGDYDVTLSATRLTEFGGDEFSRDPRIGLPVISTPEALTLIMECFPDGLLVLDTDSWRRPVVIPDQVADLVEARMTPLDLPEGVGVVAYYWERTAEPTSPDACVALPMS